MAQPPPRDPGAEPGRDDGMPGDEGRSDGPVRDERLSGFARGGQWDRCAPGPKLVAVLAEAGGPEWRCPGAEPDELIGVLRRVAAVESWVAAAKLGVIRELIRQDDLPVPGRSRRGALPHQWSDSLTHELALALATSAQSADKLMWTACELASRLPGTGRLLADGTLTLSKAGLIAETFQGLSAVDATRAEEQLLPQLTGPTGKTFGQVERLAAGIAAATDPGLAERQRKAAERERSRVQMFRERSGAAALSGRDLPTDETLAAYANVNARTGQYKESRAFPDARMDQLRAMAYLDLLNGVTADARIACAIAEAEAGAGLAGQASPDGQAEPDGWPGPAGGPIDCSCRECDGGCGDQGDEDSGDRDGPCGNNPGGDGSGGDAPRDKNSPSGNDRSGNDRSGDGPGGDVSLGGHTLDQDLEQDQEQGLDPDLDPDLDPELVGRPAVADLVIPLLTLLGLAERPGEGQGLGPLDPGLCRDLAATAANWPGSRWCLTVTDRDGVAIGHGCAKPPRTANPGRTVHPDRAARASRGKPPPGASATSLAALPARVNLTIPLSALEGLRGRPRPPAPWAFTPRGDPGPEGYGPWALFLPGGLELAVTLEPVPVYSCDHRHESHAYKPNGTLRHLVQVRDWQCTFPMCSRHARESDFEHAVPYDKGGRTCACNAGARSRKCHRVKQSPGWNVTQPRPGWHQWTTPAGRIYTQGPKRYPG